MLLTPGTSNAVSFGFYTVLVLGILEEFSQEGNRGGIEHWAETAANFM